jgi:hypothetical protein
MPHSEARNGANGNNSQLTAKPPRALPDKYDEAKVAWILALVGDGMSLKEAVSEAGIERRTFQGWVIDDNPPGLARMYARARDLQCEAWADRILHVAKTCREGVRTIVKPDGGVETITGDMIERCRLEVDSLKWLLSKLRPKQYGEKAEMLVAGDPSRPVVIAINPFKNHREIMAERAPLELANGNDDPESG